MKKEDVVFGSDSQNTYIRKACEWMGIDPWNEAAEVLELPKDFPRHLTKSQASVLVEHVGKRVRSDLEREYYHSDWMDYFE